MTATYLIGECKVTVGPAWVVTVFPDGTRLDAHAQHGPEDIARAVSLGYGGDVDRMTREHDLLHSILAAAQGLPLSPTLYGQAIGHPAPRHMADMEERTVLLLQRLLNVGLGPVLDEMSADAIH